MEPMALGSPIGSPSSNPTSFPSTSTQSSHYLPGYLMGDITSQVGARSFQTSPMKMSKPAPVSYLSTSPPHSASTVTPKTIRFGKTDKPGGPPVQSLFSSVTSPATPSEYVHHPSTSHISLGTSVTDYSGCHEESDSSMWVTIYGFPPSAASYILTQASLWGHVLEHRTPAQGNWMHVKFASKLQARKALARNSRLLTETLMIGVVPCTDPHIVEETRKENIPVSSTPSVKVMPSTPLGPSTWDRSGSFALGTSATPSALDRSSLRPLTQAYKGAQADYEVTPQRATPQQNTSLVSKAMEFVFGW